MGDISPDRATGSLLGGVLGSAIGLASITTPDRTPHLTFPALIPDDAGLALALAEALSTPTHHLTNRIGAAFARWWLEDRHGQAPDRDTLRGCKALHENRFRGDPGTHRAPRDATSPAPLTRAHPVGLFVPSERVSDVAATQAALTHGHPVPVVAAVGWAQVVHAATRGTEPDTWPEVYLRAVAEVGWAAGGAGTRECLDAWERLEKARPYWEPGSDPLPRRVGGDVTAAELAAGCLFYAQTMADEPMGAVLAAAQAPCSPAPDMCAAATGALLGAWHGRGVWASSWVSAVDATVRGRVERLVDAWVRTPVG